LTPNGRLEKRTSSAWYFCDAKWRVTPFRRPEFPALLA
jgi:hypothetical protein